jgi:hypothetical protein
MYRFAILKYTQGYALGYRQLGEGDFDLRTLYYFRERLSRHMQETGVNLLDKAFEQVTDAQIAEEHAFVAELVEPERSHVRTRAFWSAGALVDAGLPRDDIPLALTQLRDAIQATTDSLIVAGRTIDGVLERAIASRQRRLATVADDLERLLERHLRKRGDIGYAQYLRLRQALRPHGAPQERALSTPSFLARYGHAWPAAVRARASCSVRA